jgi:MoaA/NifB/PqqE/SkfB family radical SAM enzyme
MLEAQPTKASRIGSESGQPCHRVGQDAPADKRKASGALDLLDARILSFYQEALLLRRGEMCRPRFAIIYPTYVCNHACLGCDYSDDNGRDKPAMLSGTQLNDVLEQVAGLGVRAVEFCGGGEPLLHPHIEPAIEKLRKMGLSIGLLTNGTEVSPARAELLARACSYVRVSVEAGSESTYRRVKRPRSPGGLEDVLANVAMLIRHRDRLGSPCQISLKYAISKHNRDDLEQAIHHATRLGVDSIQFKSIRNVPSELTIGEKRVLNRKLEALRSEYPSVRILGDLLPYRSRVPCWLSPLHVTIDAAGDVFICCYFRHRRERHKFGNVFERSLQELWYSPEHFTKLAAIRKEECERYDCRFMKYAEAMDDALDHGQLDFL